VHRRRSVSEIACIPRKWGLLGRGSDGQSGNESFNRSFFRNDRNHLALSCLSLSSISMPSVEQPTHPRSGRADRRSPTVHHQQYSGALSKIGLAKPFRRHDRSPLLRILFARLDSRSHTVSVPAGTLTPSAWKAPVRQGTSIGIWLKDG